MVRVLTGCGWQLSVHGNWLWNSDADYIAGQYEAVSQHIQTFRDITPDSGAYFVRPVVPSFRDAGD